MFFSGEPMVQITDVIRGVFSTLPSLTLIRRQQKKLEGFFWYNYHVFCNYHYFFTISFRVIRFYKLSCFFKKTQSFILSINLNKQVLFRRSANAVSGRRVGSFTQVDWKSVSVVFSSWFQSVCYHNRSMR